LRHRVGVVCVLQGGRSPDNMPVVPNLVFAPSPLDFDGSSSVEAQADTATAGLYRRLAEVEAGAAAERGELQAVVEEQRATISELQYQMERITAHVQVSRVFVDTPCDCHLSGPNSEPSAE
jgi:hypothetical protein